MSANRNGPIRIITDGVMTGTNTLTSSPFGIHTLTHIGCQEIRTGTGVGTITIECSVNFNPLTSTGDWETITLALPITQPAGAAGSQVIDLTGLPYPYARVKYVNTSGVGVLNVWAFGKGA